MPSPVYANSTSDKTACNNILIMVQYNVNIYCNVAQNNDYFEKKIVEPT